MPNFQISDTFELSGKWWIPGHEDKGINGTLYYSPDAIKLKLHGILSTKPAPSGMDALRSAFQRDATEEIDTIFGETKNGPFSLLNAFSTSTNTSLSYGVSECTYSANLLIQRGHISSLDVPCTDIWFGSTLHERFFKLPIFNAERTAEPWSVTVTFTGQKETPYQTAPNERLILNTSVSELPGPQKVEIHSHSSFKLAVSTSQPLKRQLNRMWSVCNLFTLLTDEIVAPTYCDVQIDGQKDSIRVFYSAKKRLRSETPKAVMPLLTMENVENILESALERWLKADGKVIGSAILLFLEGRENNYPSIEGQFLVLTQGLEAISRATMTSEYMTEAEYEKVLQVLYQAIPASLEQGHKASLKKKIKHGHEHSLRKRITALVESLEEETQQLVCESTNNFVSGVVETRNYLNHYTNELREKAFTDGEQMYWANVRMTMLLRILLLKYVGLDQDTIREAMKGHRLGRLAKRAKHFPECVT